MASGERLQGRGADAPLQSVPALPAIYLAKKSIRKQGALVDHEKVGALPFAG